MKRSATIAAILSGSVAMFTPALGLHCLAARIVLSPPARAAAHYNLARDGLAIEGYDPVAYFPEGGDKPVKGDARFEHTHEGVKYRFASRENLDRFKADPAKYEPAYGGWCAYAMGNNGTKVEIDPKSFTVENDRLFLFYKDFFTETRNSWLKDEKSLLPKAEANWKKTSGEDPRLGGKKAEAAESAAGSTGGLQAKLDDMKNQSVQKAPKEMIALYEDGIKQVADSGVMASALQVGATAPDFTLNDATGKPVQLQTMLESGPVVLTWYRGGWCPYCNVQLHAYQESLAEIRAAGGQLVALTPEKPDGTVTTAEKHGLKFAVLSDTGNAVGRQYGIVYKLPESLIEKFKGRLDLPKINGDESWELPLAATYVIGRDGKIVRAFVDADYRKRDEPAAIVAALRKMK